MRSYLSCGPKGEADSGRGRVLCCARCCLRCRTDIWESGHKVRGQPRPQTSFSALTDRVRRTPDYVLHLDQARIAQIVTDIVSDPGPGGMQEGLVLDECGLRQSGRTPACTLSLVIRHRASIAEALFVRRDSGTSNPSVDDRSVADISCRECERRPAASRALARTRPCPA